MNTEPKTILELQKKKSFLNVRICCCILYSVLGFGLLKTIRGCLFGLNN